MSAYYNEIDPAAAHVLRALIAENIIAPGEVDERSIHDVRPDELRGFTQCHFFAGGGLWSVAARLAGWPDDRPLWTGSCPCQPFSVAGKGAGADDPRHLWPDFFRLIRECRPPVVVGEQVSNATGTRRPVDKDVQSMWAGEDLLGILSDAGQARQFEWLARAMQDVLPGMAGELSDWLEGAEVGFFPEIQGEEPRYGAGYGRALSSEAGGLGLRSRPVHRSTSSEDRQGALRAFGLTFPIGRGQDVGQPFARPDHPGAWLHDHERARGAVCLERDDEHLGRGAGVEGRGWDQGIASSGAGSPVGEMGDQAEREAIESWLDGVSSDLDAVGYAFGSTDIPACAVDAPHIRQRLYWVGVANRFDEGALGSFCKGQNSEFARGGRSLVGHAESLGRRGRQDDEDGRGRERAPADTGAGVLAYASRDGQFRGAQCDSLEIEPGQQASQRHDHDGRRLDARGSFWSDAELRLGADGKARRVKPGVRLLVDGLPGRVGLLRIGGNAIVPQIAAEVLAALMEAC